MRKYITFVLVALLLVCAVSCSATKNMGKLEVEIDTTAVDNAKAWDTIEKAMLKISSVEVKGRSDGAEIVLNLEDVKDGKVKVYLPEGAYTGSIVLQSNSNFSGELKFVEVKTPAPDTFTIKDGKTTKCTCTLTGGDS